MSQSNTNLATRTVIVKAATNVVQKVNLTYQTKSAKVTLVRVKATRTVISKAIAATVKKGNLTHPTKDAKVTGVRVKQKL